MGNLMISDSNLSSLLKLLDEAHKIAEYFSGGHSGQFLSAEEFHQALGESIGKLKQGDYGQLEKLTVWFLPTSSWDDFTGVEGIDIGAQISDLVMKMNDGR